MANCNITLKLGKTYTGTFTSDSELDQALLDQASTLKKWYIKSDYKLDKIFQINSKDEAIDIIDFISQTYRDSFRTRGLSKSVTDDSISSAFASTIDGADDYKGHIKGTISMSKICEYIGGKNDLSSQAITKMNQDWEIYFRQKEAERLGMDLKTADLYIPAITNEWNKQVAKNKFSAEIGEDVHTIMELLFRQVGDPSIKIDDSKCKHLKGDVFDKTFDMLKRIADDIKSKHPNATYYPEFSIISKKFDNNVKSYLNAQNINADQCSGRIDLLVVDEDGKVSIYDWKTSVHEIGDWAEMRNDECAKNGWKKSANKISNLLQIGGYGAMLQQYGLDVDEKNLVSFVTNFTVTKNAKGEWIIDKLNPITYSNPIVGPKGITQQTMANARQQQMEFIFTNNRVIDDSNLKASNEFLRIFFPQTDLANTKIKQFTASIDFYKKKKNFLIEITDTNNEHYKKGKRFFFFKEGLGKKAEPVFCATMEEVDEELKKYVAELENHKQTEMTQFGKNLQKVIATGGVNDDLINGQWLASFSDEKKKQIQNSFRKYYENGWNFVDNEGLIANGVFLFNKNDKMEMVLMTNQDPRYLFLLNGHENICGTKLKDNDPNTDPYFTFKSYVGNMYLMKGMAILASNPQLLKDCKFQSMKVVNPWHGTEFQSYSNSKLVQNWNLLCQTFPEAHAPTLSSEKFIGDTEAWMNTALELSTNMKYNIFADRIIPGANDVNYDYEEILKMMKYMLREYRQDVCEDIHTPEGRVFYNLANALLASNGFKMVDEQDAGKYLNGMVLNGTYISTVDQSNSTFVRTIGRMMADYREMYVSSFINISSQFTELVNKVFDAWGFNQVFDSPTKFWAQFFEHDENGNITTMCLRNPNDKYFTEGRTKEQTKSAQNLIDFIADYLNQAKGMRFGPEQIELAKATGEYYQMPLQEAKVGQFVRDEFKREGAKGVITGLWQSAKYRLRDPIEEIFQGGRIEQRRYEHEASPYNGAYNMYLNITEDIRERLLSQKNRVWNTDIQSLFLEATAAQCVTEASRHYAPQFLAMKIGLKYNNSIGANTKELDEWVERYIGAKVLNRKVTDASLDWLRDVISGLKSITSTVTLGFASRPFARELLVDLYQAHTRAFTQILPGITNKEFTEALAIVGRHKPISLEGENLITEICKRMAMSSYSAPEMAFSSKVKRYGLRQGWNEMTFMGSKLPDDYFRMAICIASMLHDGCYEAYETTDKGVVYNIAKDKRFNKLFKSDGTIIKIDDSDDKLEWRKQEALYKKYISDWKRVGINIEYGKTLPDCYSPQEKSSLRDKAGSLYGFFDSEDKSLLTATTLGSLFMQYKTFLSAKINQHLKHGGWENIWNYHQCVNSDGELMFRRNATEEEIKDGKGDYINLPESKVESDPHADEFVPIMLESGTYTQGMIQSTGSFILELLNCRSQEDFNKLWSDERRRGQFLNGIFDTLGLIIFAALVKLWYGEDAVNNKAEQDWWTQWSYGVLMGFAEDGPIGNVVSSAVGDGTPPALSSIQQWLTTCNSVLAGNKSVANGLVSTFGATRELRGLSYFID